MLTRDFLMTADCKTAFGAIEESLLWSAEQRAASLAATLACRPDDGSVWIFGYGSLIWNPALNYRESCTGTLPGWHRAFWLRLTAGLFQQYNLDFLFLTHSGNLLSAFIITASLI